MGRPKGTKVAIHGELPELVEYKNITENEKMWLEIYGDEEEKHLVEVKPNDIVFFNKKDLKNMKQDLRLLEGRLVPTGSTEEMSSTRELRDTMTSLELEYFIKNVNDVTVLIEQLDKVKSIHTVGRLLKEAKNPENMKTYEYVSIIEKRFSALTKEHESWVGKVEKE